MIKTSVVFSLEHKEVFITLIKHYNIKLHMCYNLFFCFKLMWYLSFLSLVVQTQLYIEDWIGLKTLDEAGRVKYISVPGNHLGISRSGMQKYVVPYLDGSASRKNSTEKDSNIRMRGVHGRVVQGNKREQTVPQFEESASI